MLNYFKPLRRKLGVVMLVGACLFVVGWVRSLNHVDVVMFPIKPTAFDSLYSIAGTCVWQRTQVSLEAQHLFVNAYAGPKHLTCETRPISNWRNLDVVAEFGLVRWQFLGFAVTESLPGQPDEVVVSERYLHIPYWFFVLPLTLGAAWFMLSKSRFYKSKSMA